MLIFQKNRKKARFWHKFQIFLVKLVKMKKRVLDILIQFLKISFKKLLAQEFFCYGAQKRSGPKTVIFGILGQKCHFGPNLTSQMNLSSLCHSKYVYFYILWTNNLEVMRPKGFHISRVQTNLNFPFVIYWECIPLIRNQTF